MHNKGPGAAICRPQRQLTPGRHGLFPDAAHITRRGERRDHRLDRKILIGAFEGDSRPSKYFDGLFDQLPQSFTLYGKESAPANASGRSRRKLRRGVYTRWETPYITGVGGEHARKPSG
ncbi:MAG TPA: hypothetical protein VJ233_15620, partial [Hyphomicrobiaceae bacterium]|nr:hypothetical protein [Hyphomicrobiaceae bacterium]